MELPLDFTINRMDNTCWKNKVGSNKRSTKRVMDIVSRVLRKIYYGVELTKMRNDLNQPETTYNEQETTYNDLQRVRRNLQWSEPTYNKQKKTRNDQQQAYFEIILQYGARCPPL